VAGLRSGERCPCRYGNSIYFRSQGKTGTKLARKIICMKESSPPPEHWMQEALKAAEEALPLDVPVGAVVVYRGEIIARAYNRREIDSNPVAHAELLALQQAAAHLGRWRLSETTLYVTLEPCPMCASAIQQARVSEVIFGAYDPVMGACGSRWAFLMDASDVAVRGGLLEAPCAALLKDFFREMRTKPSKESQDLDV
jgi:tRNA(adenine34) deaminase